MPAKPYSFRYPHDVETAMKAWEGKFKEGLGTDDAYWNVMRYLRDRDRDLENYLSLGVGQGILAAVLRQNSQAFPGGALADITGMTLTVTVPANRVIRITAVVPIENDSATDPNLVTVRLQEGIAIRASRNVEDLGVAPTDDEGTAVIIWYTNPTAGTHTYFLRADGVDSFTATGATNDQMVLSIEDVGPTGTISFIAP